MNEYKAVIRILLMFVTRVEEVALTSNKKQPGAESSIASFAC